MKTWEIRGRELHDGEAALTKLLLNRFPFLRHCESTSTKESVPYVNATEYQLLVRESKIKNVLEFGTCDR